MQNKAIEALVNAKGNTYSEILNDLEKNGWKLINADLARQEDLAREWENTEMIHHNKPGECDQCDEQREAWESIHGRSAAE
jgi:hypothetical protein